MLRFHESKFLFSIFFDRPTYLPFAAAAVRLLRLLLSAAASCVVWVFIYVKCMMEGRVVIVRRKEMKYIPSQEQS